PQARRSRSRSAAASGPKVSRSLASRRMARARWGTRRVLLTVFDGDVLTLDVAIFRQPALKCRYQMGRILSRSGAEIPDHRHLRLLRARRKRPCGRRTTEQRDELAALHLRGHSITSSARASSEAQGDNEYLASAARHSASGRPRSFLTMLVPSTIETIL